MERVGAGLAGWSWPDRRLRRSIATKRHYDPTLGATILGLTGYATGIPLDLIGMSGCFQYAALDVLDAYVVAQSTAAYSFTVPAQPALAGVHVFTPALSFAAGANAFGAILSNGVDLRIEAL